MKIERVLMCEERVRPSRRHKNRVRLSKRKWYVVTRGRHLKEGACWVGEWMGHANFVWMDDRK